MTVNTRFLSDEETISETSGLSSMNQLAANTANEIFSFNFNNYTGNEVLFYFPLIPYIPKITIKEDILDKLKKITKNKVVKKFDLKKAYYDQLENKYKDVF